MIWCKISEYFIMIWAVFLKLSRRLRRLRKRQKRINASLTCQPFLSCLYYSTAAVISSPLSRRFDRLNERSMYVCSPGSSSMTFGHAEKQTERTDGRTDAQRQCTHLSDIRAGGSDRLKLKDPAECLAMARLLLCCLNVLSAWNLNVT